MAVFSQGPKAAPGSGPQAAYTARPGMRHVRLAAVLRVSRPSSFAPKVILALETLSCERPPTRRNAALDLCSWTAVCRCRVKLCLPCSLVGILPRINTAEACLGSELHRESSAFALRIAPAILKLWGICRAFARCISAEGRYWSLAASGVRSPSILLALSTNRRSMD